MAKKKVIPREIRATAPNKNHGMVACYDHQRRTCIKVESNGAQVKFIPLDITDGLAVSIISEEIFNQRFKPMDGYPIEKACQLYLGYSQNIGATQESLDYIGKVINITNEEYNMATAKNQSKLVAPSNKTKKVVSGVEKSTKKSMSDKEVEVGFTSGPSVKIKSVEVKSNKTPKNKVPKKTSVKKLSASQVFKNLIMAGKLTDLQIFDQVKAEFGLDDSKRGYVKWYRNHLKKQGLNPPEPKSTN